MESEDKQSSPKNQAKRGAKLKMRKPRKSAWNVNEQILYMDFLQNNLSMMKN